MNERAYNDLRDAIKKALSKEDVELSDLDLDYDRDMLGNYLTGDRNLWQSLNALEDDRYDEKYKGKDRAEHVEEEVVARCCESFLRDSKFVRQMAEQHYRSAREITLFLKQFTKDVSTVQIDAAVRAYEGGYDTNDISTENNLLRDYADIEKIADLWVKGLREIADKRAKAKKAENAANSTKPQMFSINDSFAKDVAEWYENGSKERRRFRLGKTSSVISTFAKAELDIFMDSDKIADIKSKHHTMTLPIIQQIPNILESPILVMESMTEAGRLVVYGDVFDNSGNPVLAAVELYPTKKNGKVHDYSVVVSAYPKAWEIKDYNKRIEAVQRFINDSDIKYVEPNKKRTQTWLKRTRLSLPIGVKFGFNDIVTDTNRFVKGSEQNKASISDKEYRSNAHGSFVMDSKGKNLSMKQIEYFDKSKVRDKEGRLRPVYHYTNESFTEFRPMDASKGSRRTHGDGYYVSTNATEFAEFGKNKMVMYANITNPFEMTMTEEEANKVYDKYAAKFHTTDKFGLYREHAVGALQSSYKVMDYLSEYAEQNGIQISDILKDLGYDGVHDGSEWVAYDSNQLKNIDNLNPTTDKDTRYSISDREYLDLARKYESGDKSAEAELRKAVDAQARAKGYMPVARFHQTKAAFNRFSTDNPVAGLHDSETPNGIFLKTNDHDIGIGGSIQMPLYLASGNYLHFLNRKEANAWYCKNVQGYESLQNEMEAKLKEFEDRIAELEKQEFDPSKTDEEVDKLFDEEQRIIDEMRPVENEYRMRLRELLNQYFLKGKHHYDGIELDYDGHRWVDGKRENVHTFIAFRSNQVKSADLITRDNNGNIIPLSERFNEKEEDIRHSIMDKDFRMTKRGNVRTFEQNGTTANVIGSSVELEGGSLLNRVRMMHNLAEEYGSVRVDAASAGEAEAFKRAGAEHVEEGLEGRGAEYGTWEFKYQRQPGQDIYDPKQKVKFAKDIVKYKMPGIAA